MMRSGAIATLTALTSAALVLGGTGANATEVMAPSPDTFAEFLDAMRVDDATAAVLDEKFAALSATEQAQFLAAIADDRCPSSSTVRRVRLRSC